MNRRELMELVDAAYDTGYYAGEGESGSDVHRDRIKDREALREKLLVRLTAADALAEKAEQLLECIRMGWPQGYAAMVLHAALRKYREAGR